MTASRRLAEALVEDDFDRPLNLGGTLQIWAGATGGDEARAVEEGEAQLESPKAAGVSTPSTKLGRKLAEAVQSLD